jgi:hypothetical protein
MLLRLLLGRGVAKRVLNPNQGLQFEMGIAAHLVRGWETPPQADLHLKGTTLLPIDYGNKRMSSIFGLLPLWSHAEI